MVFRDAEPGCRILERGYAFRRFKGGDHGVQRHEFGRGSGFGLGLGLDFPALLAEHVLDRLVVRVFLSNPMAVVTGDEPRTVPHFAQLLGEGGEIHTLGLGLRGGLGGVTPGRFPVVVPPPCAFPVVIVVGHHADQRRKGIAPGVGDGAAH